MASPQQPLSPQQQQQNRQQGFRSLLQQQSNWAVNQMNQGYIKNIPQRETTITDVILLAIATGMGPALSTTFPDESTTGADWLWEAGGRRVLCQAKIMDIATGNYNHLDHVVGGPTGGRYQVDILREYAKTQNALACYVLYNSGLSNLSGQFDPTNTGCFVVSADDINTQIIAHVHAQYTGDTSLTWQAIKPKASTWDVLATYLYPLQ